MHKDILQVAKEKEPLTTFKEQDDTHGRQVTRTVSVFTVENEKIKATWQNVQSYITVHRIRVVNGKTSEEMACYMSDLCLAAADFHIGIRGHWGIENKLHYVKDVVHKEDDNKIHSGNGPISASVFSSVAINIHRKNDNESITHGQIKFRANVKELFDLIRT